MKEVIGKVCTKCRKWKFLYEYSFDKRTTDGRQCSCRQCNIERQKLKALELSKSKIVYDENLEKECTVCHKLKKINKFHKSILGKFGRKGFCKSCEREKLNKIREFNLNNEKPIKDIKEKKCAKCGIVKNINEYNSNVTSLDGKYSYCRKCANSVSKEVYISNTDEIKAKHNEYYRNNRDKVLKNQKEFFKIEENINRKRLKAKERFNRNKKEVNKKHREYGNKLALYESYKDKLTVEESPICGEDGLLLVKCSKCGEYFTPKNYSVRSRVSSLENYHKGTSSGENRLYCSDKCKNECPIFGAIKVPKDFRIMTNKARCGQERNRKALLDLQLDEFGYNFCEKCGKEFQQNDLKIHHGTLVSDSYKEADDMGNQFILCHEHHTELHRNCK